MQQGPIDNSVLYLQDKHITSNGALMQAKVCATTIDHSTCLKKVTTSHPKVLQAIERAGFLHIMKLGYIHLDRHLITALVERWRPETSSFHFPMGEMTITLADVAVLLGLPIDGAPVALLDKSYHYMELCESFLGMVPPACKTWGHEMIMSSWFREELEHDIPLDATDIQVAQRARAIILHTIISRLLVDHSKSRLSLSWIPYLVDLDACGRYSWGSAVLCYMYNELSNFALGHTKSVGGCLTLLQVWSWTYLPVGRQTLKMFTFDGSLPLGSKWVGAKKYTPSSSRTVPFYRDQLNELDEEIVTWSPYTHDVLAKLPKICTSGINLWRARVPLICLSSCRHHLPDRVMRQFGLSQHIPENAPYYHGTKFKMNDYNLAIYQWSQRHMFVQFERDPTISVDLYHSWYWSITLRYVLKATKELSSCTHQALVNEDAIYKTNEHVNEVDDKVKESSKGKWSKMKTKLKNFFGNNKKSKSPPPTPAQAPSVPHSSSSAPFVPHSSSPAPSVPHSSSLAPSVPHSSSPAPSVPRSSSSTMRFIVKRRLSVLSSRSSSASHRFSNFQATEKANRRKGKLIKRIIEPRKNTTTALLEN